MDFDTCCLHITNNGLWIKDEYDNNTYVINADELVNNTLKNVTINQLDKNFSLRSIIISEEANIENKRWQLNKVKIFFEDGKKEISFHDSITFVSNIAENSDTFKYTDKIYPSFGIAFIGATFKFTS